MSKTPLGQMIIELGLDSTDFGKGLTSAKREVRTWSAEMSASMRAADLAGNKIGKLQARYDGLTKIISAQQKQVDSLKQSYDNSFVDGKATAQTEKLASQLKKAEADLITYNKELRNAAGELAKVKVQTEGLTGALRTGGEGLQKFGKGATAFGDTLTKKVSLPLMAGVTLAIKAASDWESSFAGVMKTNDEVVDSNGKVVYSYKDLEDGLRDMAKELPATHAEIAEVAEAAGQLGIEAENVTSFTRTMIDMGESTNLGAEQAASSLARLANITGMSQNDFDRLGSAIVGLGNNFATTEAEITDMALRLAGTGNQIGMTEADILGLAAAMSSVGINAEAGGTAMSTVLKKMQNAVADNSEELKLFANVADVSAKEFAKAFEEDPARALQLFVEGLEQSSKEGKNLNAILDGLGIKGIREADTLLRLAGNSKLLGDALDLSAVSWEENTALAEEAQTRYETLESQLGMLRNEAVDVAINFGGPFVKAIREALGAAKPFIGAVSDLAEAFANADEETQQSILRMVGFGIAAGPVIGTVGRFSTGLGDATVKTVDFLAEMAKKKTIDDFGGAAVTASGAKGIGGMTLALSGLNPWLVGLVGAGGLLTVGYGAWKLWGEDAWEAGERTKKWGTDVTAATDSVLTDIQETGGRFTLMQQGLNADSGLMVQDFQSLGQVIEDDINRRLEITEAHLSGLPTVLQGTLREMWEEHNAGLIKTRDAVIANNEEIARVQAQVAEQGGKATAEQLAYINELQRSSSEEYISILNLTAEEEKAIRAALSGDIESISQEQAATLYKSLADEKGKLSQERRQLLDETEAWLIEMGQLNTDFGRESLQAVEKYYEAMGVTGQRTMQELVELYPDLVNTINLASGDLLSTNAEARDIEIQTNKAIMDSWDERTTNTEQRADEIKRAQELIVDSNRAGATTWNRLVAESGGNMDIFREKVMETAKTAEGWNHMRFQIHEANLGSNARLIIAEAAIQNGYWDGMAWEDKQALLKDNFSETVYKAIVDEGTWDKLTWEEQFAVLNNEFSDGVIQAIMDEGKWKDLPWEQKHAVLTTNSPETLKQVLEDIGVWKTLPIPVRNLLADKTQLDRTVENAKRKLNELRDREVTLTVRNQTIYESIYRTQGNKASSDWVQSGGRILHNERGTNYHPGGMAMVNDQKGSIFRELIQHPDGSTYIPYGRNVILDLPKGAKVLRASLTKQRFPDIPQYREGIGNIPVESTVIQNINNTRSRMDNTSTKNIQVENLLKEVVRKLDDIRSKKDVTEINQTNHIHGVKPSERELVRESRIALEQLAYKLRMT